jgi:hypothetical protein
MDQLEKYALAVRENENDHETLNNWGSALFDAWGIKGEKALLVEAVSKIEMAISINPKPIYHSNMARILLWLSMQNLVDSSSTDGIEHFRAALVESAKGNEDLFVRELKDYFYTLASPENVDPSMYLISIVKENGNKHYLSALRPFVIANMCWANKNNEKRLDSMPQDLAAEAKRILEKDLEEQ